MNFRLSASLICLAFVTPLPAQELNGVDLSGLSSERKAAALKILNDEGCTCGCSMKVAECRVKDPGCAVSRGLAGVLVKELRAGKTPDQARAVLEKDMERRRSAGRSILDEPVALSLTGTPVKGPATARLTVVEFSDFQCPYCSVAVANAEAMLKAYPNDVKLVFKQFPLETHPQAHFAAEAALAAHAQGKFWPMHDKLFANPHAITRDHVLVWAKEIGLDLDHFTKDLDSHKYQAEVDNEINEGVSVGVQGTPTFFINGQKLNGPLEVATIKPVLDAELKKTP